MKRALALALLVLIGAGAVGACADSTESLPLEPRDDASAPIPPSEAGPIDDAGSDAADAHTEGGTGLAACTEDGWCKIALPDSRSIGLETFRIVALAMDGAGGVIAATNSNGFAGDPTSHLLRYDGKVWTTLFGIGPQQAGPFPWRLMALADNGAGTLLAVGKYALFDRKGPIVLRIENGVVTDEYPTLPEGLASVAFTSAEDVWALDDVGNLYRATLGSGALEWTLVEDVPHRPGEWGFPRGPKAMFVSPAGKLILAGADQSSWPAPAYVDREAADGGWTSSLSDLPGDQPGDVQAGVAATNDVVWLAAYGSLLRVSETPGGVEWTETFKTARYQNALWARGSNEAYAVGPVGRIYRYDGTKWTDLSLALNGAPLTTNYLTAITGSSTGELWLGGEDVALHYTPRANP